MTKEELRKEAEDIVYGMGYDTYESDGHSDFAVQDILVKLLEPREKRIAELEKENAELKEINTHTLSQLNLDNGELIIENEKLKKENAELRKIAEFQQSSNMSRHFENKKLKEGLAVGSIFNKALNSMNKSLEEERDRYREMTFDMKDQLTKAKELLKRWVELSKPKLEGYPIPPIQEQTEQFLSEVENV